mmetsp:Transcript_23586/g.20649  ORF Transcript_23586/g.20649 Transcript_23586/m.20649 type:complete len:132 (+) Transcript_23586:39-434(+)
MLYDKYNENGINFVSIYIQEAHANDEWPIRTKKELRINQHTNIAEKVKAAKFMQEYTGWKIPLFVDGIDGDNFENRFHAWPFRVFAMDSKNRLIWMMEPQPNDGLFDFKQIEQQIQLAMTQHQRKDSCIIL